jgi:hypothetical protein
MMKLSDKHRMFVEAFDGDLPYAMRIAGYNGTDMYLKQKGEELLSTPLIQQAIEHRKKYVANLKETIATREERQLLWSQIMKNEDPYRKEELDENGVPIPEGNIPLPVRLKASELLGKSEADFIDKVDVNHSVTLSDIILKSYNEGETKSIEDIEAEYYAIQENRKLEDLI